MRKITITLLAGLAVMVASPVLAQGNGNGGGNGAPSGGHYNLNIIGVKKGKTADMTGGGHVIFVELTNTDGVASKIYLVQGDHFEVCDGNSFDAAYDCTGAQIQSTGAVFMLPCNSNLTPGTDPDGEPSTLYPCDAAAEGFIQAYEVWIRELGTPGGNATMTTCATEVGDRDNDAILNELLCSTENVILTRTKGKSTFRNVTQELTSLVVCYDADPTVGRGYRLLPLCPLPRRVRGLALAVRQPWSEARPAAFLSRRIVRTAIELRGPLQRAPPSFTRAGTLS